MQSWVMMLSSDSRQTFIFTFFLTSMICFPISFQENIQSISYMSLVLLSSFILNSSTPLLPLSSLSSPDLPPGCQLFHRHCVYNLEQHHGGSRAYGVGGWRHRSPTQLQRHKQWLWSYHAGVRDGVQRHHHTVPRRMCGQRQLHTNDQDRQGSIIF